MSGRTDVLKAPFPYFGGKSRVAAEVWERFGDVPNYVEPFAGSLAVLLARPHEARTETVNDIDCYLANFWRAVRLEPDAVAAHADYPVSEVDLVARHHWMLKQSDFRARMKAEPEYYDAKIAGWWCWGACAWIRQGWCAGWQRGDGYQPEQIPHLGDAGRGAQILAYFGQISMRLRDVRIACGDWTRVLGPSVTFRHGTTAVLLDPPYGEGEMDYAAGGNTTGIAQDVAAWAIENGENKEMRIAYCGYDGAVAFPDSWECFAWKNRGGYGSQGEGEGRENAGRERIWFSPHCIADDKPEQRSLFEDTP